MLPLVIKEEMLLLVIKEEMIIKYLFHIATYITRPASRELERRSCWIQQPNNVRPVFVQSLFVQVIFVQSCEVKIGRKVGLPPTTMLQ